MTASESIDRMMARAGIKAVRFGGAVIGHWDAKGRYHRCPGAHPYAYRRPRFELGGAMPVWAFPMGGCIAGPFA